MAWTWNWVDTVRKRFEAETVMLGPRRGSHDTERLKRPTWGFLLRLDLGPKSTNYMLITAVQPGTLQRVEGHTDSWHRGRSWSWEAQRRALQKLGHETRLTLCAEDCSTMAGPDHPWMPRRFLLGSGLIKQTSGKANLIRRELRKAEWLRPG